MYRVIVIAKLLLYSLFIHIRVYTANQHHPFLLLPSFFPLKIEMILCILVERNEKEIKGAWRRVAVCVYEEGDFKAIYIFEY